MRAKTIFLSIFFLSLSVFSQEKQEIRNKEELLQMMQDKRINFYDVVKAADKYFQTHDKDEEDSGYAKFMRWVYNNEYKYYPSGDRTKEDPLLLKHAWEQYLANTPPTRSVLNNADWQEIGPRTIDSITGHYSVGLGRVIDLLPVSPDTLFLSSEAGGLWKTTDGGQTWSPKSDGLIAEGADALECSPFNHSKMYMDVQNPGNYYSYGIYRSDDGGETWYESNFNPANVGYGGLGDDFRIFTIKCHPSIPDKIFIGTNQGLYISDDDLQTWTHVQQGVFEQHTYNEIKSIAFHPTDSNTVYVMDDYYWSDKSKIYYTNDLGQTWQTSAQIVDGNGDPNDRNAYLDTSPQCPDCVYFASDKGVWKSTDKGVSFTFLSKPNQGMAEGFAVNKNDPDNMIYGYVDVMNSTDGGQTWTQVTHWSLGSTNGTGNTYGEIFASATDYVHADLHPVKYAFGNFYIGTDGFMCKSPDNGVTWEIISFGTGIRENYNMGVSQSNMDVVINGSQDNGNSLHTDHGWVEITGGDGMEGFVLPLNDKAFIGSYQRGNRYRSFDEGVTTTGISPPGDGSWAAPIQLTSDDHYTIYDFRNGIYKSTDLGDNWVEMSADVFGSGYWDRITEAEVANNNTQILLVANGSNLKKSTDGGATFTDIAGLPNLGITDVSFDPQDDNVFFVTYGNFDHPNDKIYMTTDGGVTWTNITYNLNNIPVHAILIEDTPEHRMYAGTELGVFYKDFNATSWQVLGTDLPKVKVYELEIQKASNYLYATSWGRGLWRVKLPGRENYPEIAKVSITQPPTLTTPVAGALQYVSATINYAGNLSSVVVHYSLNNNTLDQSMNMSLSNGQWKSDTHLPGANTGDKIYFKIIATGDNNDVTESYTYMYELRPYQVCDSQGNTSYQTGTTRVVFNTIDNPTGKDAAYNDFTNLSTDVELGGTYDLTVQVNTDGSYTVHTKVWIDWNYNGSFDDPGEEYDLGTANNVADGPTSNSPLSIVVPNDAVLAATIMRVSTKYGSDPSSCATGFDGEVEDYTLNVVQPVYVPVPDINPLPDITAECEVASITPPTATDVEDGQITGVTDTTFPITTQGTTVVTWTYTDSDNHSVTQTQNVIIDDNTAPVPDAATLDDITAECEVTSLTPPTATDNCAGTVTATTNVSLPITTQGTTQITWTYDDGNGNTSTQTQNVIIDDNTAPVPDVGTLGDITAECEVTSLTPPTATDNCAGSITATTNVSLPITMQGTTQVTWTYDDGNGNTSTQTQYVIIDDNTAPVPDVATLDDITAECEVTSLTPPTATDNCAGSVTATTNVSLPITTQGTTQVTWTYDDGNGNTSTQTQYVIIDDNTAPVPDAAQLDDIVSECEITSLPVPTATDNCGGNVTVTNDANLPITTPGTVLVTWTYTDENGNNSTQTQNITYSPIDNSVTQTGNTLTANATGSYTYQWGDCSNGSFTPVSGETNQSFTPAQTGDYAVEISNGTCSVMSDCIHVTVSGINELALEGIKIYPNPSTGLFNIELSDFAIAQIWIYDVTGKEILNSKLQKRKTHVDIRKFAKGVYLLRIDKATQVFYVRIIKE